MSAHLPSEVPPERASLPGPVGAAGAAVHLPAAPLANPVAGVDRSASERAWSRPAGERWRARTAVAAELARTLVLGAAGSGGLFALLGGARLLRRAQPVGGAVGVGVVVVGVVAVVELEVVAACSDRPRQVGAEGVAVVACSVQLAEVVVEAAARAPRVTRSTRPSPSSSDSWRRTRRTSARF